MGKEAMYIHKCAADLPTHHQVLSEMAGKDLAPWHWERTGAATQKRKCWVLTVSFFPSAVSPISREAGCHLQRLCICTQNLVKLATKKPHMNRSAWSNIPFLCLSELGWRAFKRRNSSLKEKRVQNGNLGNIQNIPKWALEIRGIWNWKPNTRNLYFVLQFSCATPESKGCDSKG